jgi:hypothetical protein
MVQIDPVGLPIGAVSLLGQTASYCAAGFDLWSRSSDLGPEASYFQVRLDQEKAWFVAWAETWEISTGKHSNHALFAGNRGDIAVNTITELHELVARLNLVSDRFPDLDTAPNSAAASIARLHLLSDSESDERKRQRQRYIALQESTSRREKLQWATQKGTIDETLAKIHSLIDGLYKLYPPPRYEATTTTILNSTLNSGTQDDLLTLSKISQSPTTSMLAGLKTLSRNLKQRAGRVSVSTPVKKPLRALDLVTPCDEEDARSTATYDYAGTHLDNVLIEWKPIKAVSWQGTKALEMAIRIENVARLLQDQNKPAELCSLHCLGYCDRPESENAESAIGYIYAFPVQDSDAFPQSLNQVIASQAPVPSGAVRAALGHAISKAVVLLHLSGWLHKSIRSHNILFFAANPEGCDLASPYLAGFDFSRTDTVDSLTEIPDAQQEYDLYRHPDVQGLPVEPLRGHRAAAAFNTASNVGSSEATAERVSYSKQHDIYSLGVLLLEIGLWQHIGELKQEALHDQAIKQDTPSLVREWMVHSEAPKLVYDMGEAYMRATVKCLQSDFHAKDSLQIQVLRNVILKIAPS